MRIGTLARRLGTSPDSIRFYERQGLLPRPARTENGYREYGEDAVSRLRLLIGLRQLDLPLDQAAELAGMCADGRCNEVSGDLRELIPAKRAELRARIEELLYLDRRLAHLDRQLEAGTSPGPLITLGKEERHAS